MVANIYVYVIYIYIYIIYIYLRSGGLKPAPALVLFLHGPAAAEAAPGREDEVMCGEAMGIGNGIKTFVQGVNNKMERRIG